MTRKEKVILDGFGSFLRINMSCFVVFDSERKEVKRIPFSENRIAEVRIKVGNSVSADALFALADRRIDTFILSGRGNPAAALMSFADDRHVETRLCQYRAIEGRKAREIAEQLVRAKIKGMKEVLSKYGLHEIDDYPFVQALERLKGKDMKVVRARKELMGYEGKFSEQYFKQFFQLFDESIRPKERITFKVHDGLNNVLNLAYSVLDCKVRMALWRAGLDADLGFLHANRDGMPAFVSDFMEIYRHLADDFVVGYARTTKLSKKNFVPTMVVDHAGNKDRREYLTDNQATEFTDKLYEYFERKVEIPRITGGKRQKIETLISEEAVLFAKYLRNEMQTWTPRVVSLVR